MKEPVNPEQFSNRIPLEKRVKIASLMQSLMDETDYCLMFVGIDTKDGSLEPMAMSGFGYYSLPFLQQVIGETTVNLMIPLRAKQGV